MMKSMTAFGRAAAQGDGWDACVEVRSVNARFFDCTVRLPRSLCVLEERVKNHVREHAVSRAKADIGVTYTEHAARKGTLVLDRPYLEEYLSALRVLRDEYGLTDDISVMQVARNADIFTAERTDTDPDMVWERLLPVLDEALAGYNAMRVAEGERIRADLTVKIENICRWVDEIEKISREDTVGYRDRLEARLRSLLAGQGVTPDENRLLTECALWADKIAVDEEIVRLRSHFDAYFEIAALSEPSGRKLDFLLQEMNRETNTIGSKANNASVARLVVNIKGELEKIREQVQNIE